MLRLAQIISISISPLTLIPLLFLFLITLKTQTFSEYILAAVILYGLTFLPVVLTFAYFKKTKRISDWGVYKREERYQISIITLGCAFVAAVVSVFLLPRAISHFLIFLLLQGSVFALITRFWKISAHTATVSLFVLFVINWLGWSFWWTLVLVPIVGWARVYQRKHTLWQAVGGALLPPLIFSVVNFLGLL